MQWTPLNINQKNKKIIGKTKRQHVLNQDKGFREVIFCKTQCILCGVGCIRWYSTVQQSMERALSEHHYLSLLSAIMRGEKRIEHR